MRWMVLILLLVLGAVSGLAQDTATPTPTATNTPTPEPFVYSTTQPEITGTPGQMTRFDYVVTASDVHIANLLTWLLYSVWGMFFFGVIVVFVMRKR